MNSRLMKALRSTLLVLTFGFTAWATPEPAPAMEPTANLDAIMLWLDLGEPVQSQNLSQESLDLAALGYGGCSTACWPSLNSFCEPGQVAQMLYVLRSSSSDEADYVGYECVPACNPNSAVLIVGSLPSC